MAAFSFDEVLEYTIEYIVFGRSFTADVRITSKTEMNDPFEQEECDIMVVSKVTSPDGDIYDHESWRAFLSKAGLEQDFWEVAVEKYVMIQLCVKSIEPGEA
jgi:hypothetical protein